MTDRETVATYEAVADEYRERHGDRSDLAPLVGRFLRAVEAATDGPSARILDAGCGPGWESAAFADRGHRPVGVDVTASFLGIAREEAPGAAVARMDMRRPGFTADAFDGLWACASFLHVPREDAPETLEEFRRVLRPGGVLHLSVKPGEGTVRSSGYEGDERRFTLYRPDELEAMVEAAGFAVESVTVEETDVGDWLQVDAVA